LAAFYAADEDHVVAAVDLVHDTTFGVGKAVRVWAGHAVVGRQIRARPWIGDAEGVFDLLWLLITSVLAWVRPRQDLVLENLLLRHQLAVLTRPTRARPRPRLRVWDKLVWILARWFCASWREHLSIVTPDTVVRWHRQGWRLFWRWKSRSRGGRPHISPEVRQLIMTMSRDNRLWGTERIRGELLKLGIVVSNRSIRRYRWRGAGAPIEPDLADVLAQPCPSFVGLRPVHDTHADVQDLVYAGVHRTRPSGWRSR
jgi:hypothetical protein